MKNHASFTIKDVCKALDGVSRSRVHSWTQLSPFSNIETTERSARRFSMADLLTMAVLKSLEDQFGLKNRLLGDFSNGIYQYLSLPRAIRGDEWIFISQVNGITQRIESLQINQPGWIMDMAEERNRINIFLGIDPPQRELALISNFISHTR